jgi:hypothetical protein
MNNDKELSKLFEGLLFPKIFQAFRIAIQPKSILIAFFGVAVIFLSGWLMDFSNSVVCSGSSSSSGNELDVYLASPYSLDEYIKANEDSGNRAGVFATFTDFSARNFNSSVTSLLQLNLQQLSFNISEYCRAIKWVYWYHPIYSIIFTLIKLMVIAVAGGAICRSAALSFALGQRPGLFEVLHFSLKKIFSFFAAPLVLVAIIIGIGLFIILLGLITNIPYIGELIMGVLFPIALFLGAFIAIIAIGAIAGFNLMFPTIAYECSDCLEAISRSLSYVYTKPWRMAFYSTITLFYGAICYLFVRLLAFTAILMTRLFLDIGIFADSSDKQVDKLTAIWPPFDFVNFPVHSQYTTNWSESISVFLVYLGLLVVAGLVLAYLISFYFSANTIIYSLMRNRVDGTRLEDIYIYTEDDFLQQKVNKAAKEEHKFEETKTSDNKENHTDDTFQNEDEQ